MRAIKLLTIFLVFYLIVRAVLVVPEGLRVARAEKLETDGKNYVAVLFGNGDDKTLGTTTRNRLDFLLETMDRRRFDEILLIGGARRGEINYCAPQLRYLDQALAEGVSVRCTAASYSTLSNLRELSRRPEIQGGVIRLITSPSHAYRVRLLCVRNELACEVLTWQSEESSTNAFRQGKEALSLLAILLLGDCHDVILRFARKGEFSLSACKG